jgi:hypothetical protein
MDYVDRVIDSPSSAKESGCMQAPLSAGALSTLLLGTPDRRAVA